MYVSGKICAILGCLVFATLLGYAAGGIKCWHGGKVGEPNYTGFRKFECPEGTIGCGIIDCDYSPPFYVKGCNPYPDDYTEEQCKAIATCDDRDDHGQIIAQYPAKKCSFCVGELCNGDGEAPAQTPQNMEEPIVTPNPNLNIGNPPPPPAPPSSKNNENLAPPPNPPTIDNGVPTFAPNRYAIFVAFGFIAIMAH